jgi:hypothetical protein
MVDIAGFPVDAYFALKIQWSLAPWGFDSPLRHQLDSLRDKGPWETKGPCSLRLELDLPLRRIPSIRQEMLANSFSSAWEHVRGGPFDFDKMRKKTANSLGALRYPARHTRVVAAGYARKDLNDGGLNLDHRCNKTFRSCEGPEGP